MCTGSRAAEEAAPGRAAPRASGRDGVFGLVKVGRSGLGAAIAGIAREFPAAPLDPAAWEASRYKPTPTIIEAALALYNRHDVAEITHSEGGAENISRTTGTVERIIESSRRYGRKSICFVTGVPGAGKTLAGLNLVAKRRDPESKNAVYLSGNGPLVQVLQEALVRDRVGSGRIRAAGKRVTKGDALREARTLIQGVGNFFAEYAIRQTDAAPPEKIAVFDEAQRAWDAGATDKFLGKNGAEKLDKSQPELLIDVMGRHEGWAVLVCLVGGGQEINHNEAGLPAWLTAAGRRPEWDVYVSDRLADREHLQGGSVEDLTGDAVPVHCGELHLGTSVRSFRSERVSAFVKALLDLDAEGARRLLGQIGGRYPILLTRDFGAARSWLQEKARGSERFGVVAAAKSYRLRPHGIYVELTTDAPAWFLNPRSDPRSSYCLEYAATEFKVQGLELDWVCVAWDADLRRAGGGWDHREFRGDAWTTIRKEDKKRYLENAYRVLLTRARQGMVIFVPEGDPLDGTRRSEYYDGTYRYLRDMGVEELPAGR